MIWARIQDAMDIWAGDRTQYPQGSPVQGWFGFVLRLKCSLCILLDREGDVIGGGYHVPVYVGPMCVGHSWDGPTCDWTEVSVDLSWRGWRFYRYRNGI